MPIDTIMRRWPATIAVMLRHGMLCVGCPIGAFHTVPDACLEHGVDEDTFVRELHAAIEATSLERQREDAVR
jgi:hybrid cluster-associated redox disulfide protein